MFILDPSKNITVAYSLKKAVIFPKLNHYQLQWNLSWATIVLDDHPSFPTTNPAQNNLLHNKINLLGRPPLIPDHFALPRRMVARYRFHCIPFDLDPSLCKLVHSMHMHFSYCVTVMVRKPSEVRSSSAYFISKYILISAITNITISISFFILYLLQRTSCEVNMHLARKSSCINV